jgi:hypothetical protein
MTRGSSVLNPDLPENVTVVGEIPGFCQGKERDISYRISFWERWRNLVLMTIKQKSFISFASIKIFLWKISNDFLKLLNLSSEYSLTKPMP